MEVQSDLAIDGNLTTFEIKEGPRFFTMTEVVAMSKDGATVTVDGSVFGFGGFVAVWGDRTLHISGAAWRSLIERLGEVRFVGELGDTQRFLLDFDHAERMQADHVAGLEVRITDLEWKEIRSKRLTLGEFWDALCALEGQ